VTASFDAEHYLNERFLGSRPEVNEVYYSGLELTILGLLSGRLGYVDDEEGNIQGWAYGVGIGGRKSLVRLDFADLPQAPMLDRTKQYTLAVFWGL
jgi:hypothetical protein